jgi:hypothetical protein
MFTHPIKLIPVRALLLLCLALMAGCLPRTNNPAAPVPTNLVATGGDAVVNLTWTASTGATGYNVKRSTTAGGPYAQIASPTAATYTDTSVTNGTAYYYVVSSLNAAGESANSSEAAGTPKAPAAPPPPPAGLTATAGDATVTLNWTASAGATSYHVKRSTKSGGPYTQVAAPTSTTYTDPALVNNATYFYVVTAVNSTGESANSTEVNATPVSSVPPTFGVWTNVTPANADPTNGAACGGAGAVTVQTDPAHPSNLYAEINCQGIWKSTDYGLTWAGPINTGTNATAVGDCSGGITISPTSTAAVPTIYEVCIRGTGTGFWKSIDGGVNWTHSTVAATGRQDYYPPVVDPYDQNHLLMAAHEFDSIVQSIDGGQTWTSVPMDAGMAQGGGTGFVFFIDTGTATSTRTTWLWLGQQGGTFRTTNNGTTWAKVDNNNHTPGSSQIYQPDKSGVMFMAGQFSASGDGVLRSTDFGQTWAHVGNPEAETNVIGTSKNLYAMYSFVGLPAAFEVGAVPGTGTWASPATPTGMTGAAQFAKTNDGTHNILVGAMWTSGIWRYIEP